MNLQSEIIESMHQWIIENNKTPYILVDVNVNDVLIPNIPGLSQNGVIILNIDPYAVTSFEINDDNMSFLTRFGGVSHFVSIPIIAIQRVYAKEDQTITSNFIINNDNLGIFVNYKLPIEQTEKSKEIKKPTLRLVGNDE